MEGTVTAMDAILATLTSFASWVWGQLAALMTSISENPVLFTVIFGLTLVGFVVGIIKRLIRI